MSDEEKTQLSLRKTLTGAAFVEKVVLLLLTAIISGIVGPMILSSLQRQREDRGAVLDAQSKLFDDVSTSILTYETLAADVSWFKHPDARNEEMHELAYKRYNERVVDVVASLRSEIARSRTLVSKDIVDRLDGFLKRIFLEQDTPMMRLYSNDAPDDDWLKQHSKNESMIVEANNLISAIAEDLNLTRRTTQIGSE